KLSTDRGRSRAGTSDLKPVRISNSRMFGPPTFGEPRASIIAGESRSRLNWGESPGKRLRIAANSQLFFPQRETGPHLPIDYMPRADAEQYVGRVLCPTELRIPARLHGASRTMRREKHIVQF